MTPKTLIEVYVSPLYVVYGLYCPLTGDLKYVGSTCQMLSARLGDHLKEADCSLSLRLTPKQLWIKSLRDVSLRPLIRELEVCRCRSDALLVESLLVNGLDGLTNSRRVLRLSL